MYQLIGADGREYGPASADEVRQWLAQGRVHYQTLVRRATDQSWRPLFSYPELTPPPPAVGAPGRGRSGNTLATFGFVLGVLSLLGGCCCCGCPFNLLAIVFSVVGLNQAQRDRDDSAKNLALIGLICGLLSLLETVVTSLVSWSIGAFSHGLR